MVGYLETIHMSVSYIGSGPRFVPADTQVGTPTDEMRSRRRRSARRALAAERTAIEATGNDVA